ncbi:acyltransferase family protein [Flavobacterium enshiense]|uniref:acyltransferase family protein n=1 Tax=Flavobacterium enshiense TaxID=1341165 RepID=UPI00345DA995
MANRSASLDVLKLGLAFLIVALHIFPVSKMLGISGLFSYAISSGITRIAVPTFFIVSGYLLRNKLNDKTYLIKYCKRIFLLYIVWQLIYLPDLLYHYHLKWFSTTELLYKLIYGYWHLWYLIANVLGVVLLYLSRNWKIETKLTVIFLVFVIGYMFQLAYKLNVFEQLPVFTKVYNGIGTTRNGVFFAFPFLVLGSLYDYWKFSSKHFQWFLFLCCLGLLFESFLYYSLKLGALDFFVFLLPISMFLLHWAVTTNLVVKKPIPGTLSLGIYLCHPYMIRLVYEFLPQRSFNYIVLKYFLICVLAVFGWFLLKKINERLPIFL